MSIKVSGKRNSILFECRAHTHAEWEIIYNYSGNVTSKIGDKIFSIKPGDIIIVPPNTAHDGISENGYMDMFARVENMDFHDITVVHDSDGCIGQLMEMLVKVHCEKEIGFERISDSLWNTISLYIKKLDRESSRSPFIEQLKNSIYSNISDPQYSIAHEIDNLGFNQDYLRRVFKAELGETPLEYLTRLRLNNAKALLIHDNYQGIDDVAGQCGFTDSFYFSKCFKKHVGTSPLKYRKMHYGE